MHSVRKVAGLVFIPEQLENRTFLSAGSLDTAFSGDGTNVFAPGGPFRVVSMDNRGGRTLVLGVRQDINTYGPADANLLAVNSSGNIDTTFSGDGIRPIPRLLDPQDVFIQPDGKILVVGQVDGHAGIARLLSNGAADTSFSGDGFAVFSQFTLATGVRVGSNGKIVVSGYSGNNPFQGGPINSHFAAAQLLSNGAFDTSFSGDGQVVLPDIGYANAVAVTPGGKVVLAGSFVADNAAPVGLIRLTTQGTIDTTFSGDGRATIAPFGEANRVFNGEARSIDLMPDGRILVGAVIEHSNASAIRFSESGVSEMVVYDFYPTGSSPGIDVTVRSSFDGKQFYLALNEYPGNENPPTSRISRFDDDGTRDHTFGKFGVIASAGESFIDLDANGKLVTAGNTNTPFDNSGEGPPIESQEDDYHVQVRRRLTATVATDRISFDPSTQSVYVEGSSYDDTITATRLSNGDLQVKLNSQTKTFKIAANDDQYLVIDGGRGNDNINTATANMRARANGGDGNDTINLGNGSSTPVWGFQGQILIGGAGNDTLKGGNRGDYIDGSGYLDGLRMPDGDDLLTGGAGNDLMYGGLGRDRLYGGDGDDDFWGALPDTADNVPDYLDGGNGSDAAHQNDPTDATNLVEIKDDSSYPRNPPFGL
jgi:uncharacterized delta-60 repeat protein